MRKKIKCGVVGVGYLGQFHAEKYANLPNADLISVCDIDAERVKEIASKYNTSSTTDYHALVGAVDAVSIATPTQFHHKIAKFFLENNIHVLLEKPITSTVKEADELITLAEKNGLILQVGHLERFNTVVNALEKYLDKPRFIECIRLAPFKPRGIDVNVVLDLMIHDIDLIQYIVGSPIKSLQATGARVLSDGIDLANAHIHFENHCVANVTASRVSLKQERKIRVFQQEAHIAIDLQHKQLSVNRKGSNEMFPGIPEIIREEQAFDKGDALKDEIISFLDAITHNRPPVVSGHDGKMALATAIEITNIVHKQMSLFQTHA
ncbi:MAG: NAD-dependent oxidoreductase [Gammaproteobacteria bacterium]|jgi:predicted dehydrogenase|nr:NAD-dependent oxidoreductase [Gammaproteobacteria bacterium]